MTTLKDIVEDNKIRLTDKWVHPYDREVIPYLLELLREAKFIIDPKSSECVCGYDSKSYAMDWHNWDCQKYKQLLDKLEGL